MKESTCRWLAIVAVTAVSFGLAACADEPRAESEEAGDSGPAIEASGEQASSEGAGEHARSDGGDEHARSEGGGEHERSERGGEHDGGEEGGEHGSDAEGEESGEHIGRTRYCLPRRYFYTPGASWPHKNHRVLFEALAALRRRHGVEVDLVLTGARVEGAVDVAALARGLGLDGEVHHLGYVPREDLPALYGGSLATVVPSLFEGFGIPVLEAMHAGAAGDLAGRAAAAGSPRGPEATVVGADRPQPRPASPGA